MTNYPIAERPHAINGVPGRMYPVHAPQDVRGRLVHRGQKWTSEGRKVTGYGTNGVMHVNIRFDDECKNAHQTFSIIADIYTDESRRRRDIAAGGCMHDEIAAVFPELAPLIRWHLTSTDSPMHYVANAMYHASDRDHNGRCKGDPCAWDTVIYFGNSPVSHKIGNKFAAFLKSRMNEVRPGKFSLPDDASEFRVVAIAADNKPGGYQYSPHYTFPGFGEKWHECPFRDEETAQQWALALNTIGCRVDRIITDYSEGKARDLDAARRAACWPDAARRAACWPDAPDEILTAEPDTLKAALLARLPALQAEFRSTMDACGFLWEPEQPEQAD